MASATRSWRRNKQANFRRVGFDCLRPLPLNFPGEVFAFIFFFWRYDDKYLLLFVFCGFGVDGIVRRANLFIYFTVKVLSWKNHILSKEQCVTVPRMLNDTDTDTFFRYQLFSIPIPVLFSVPIFSDTDSETFYRNQIFSIPVPIPPVKMKNSLYPW